MSSAGHVLDMIKRQKLNRELQRKARNKYRSALENLQKGKNSKVFNADLFPDKNEDEKFRIKLKIRKESRNHFIKVTIKTVITLLGIGVVLFYLWYKYRN